MKNIINIILIALITLTFSVTVSANASTTRNKKMSTEKITIEIPALKTLLVFSHPTYIADTVEETPYRLLQKCDEQRHCQTLLDERDKGGFSVSNNPSLNLSPDRLYLIVLRMIDIDTKNKNYRNHYYEIYDLTEGAVANFQTSDGKKATTDNILQWSDQAPHALEISVGRKKRAIAYKQ